MTHVTKSASFSELEARSTVALDSGDGGTRRACNNEKCSRDYEHKGPCDIAPSSVKGTSAKHRKIEELKKCLQEIKTRLKHAMGTAADAELRGFESLAAMWDETTYLENECSARLLAAEQKKISQRREP